MPEPIDDLRLRRPTGDDHARIVGLVDDWWGGRRLHDYLPRLWFEHFAGTSWVAETPDGRIAGFLVGFRSPDHPEVAWCHMIAANPNLRRRGVARSLYAAFAADARAAGCRRIEALTWPGNKPSLAFHQALGFRIDDGPRTVRLYGVPAYPDLDHPGEDRSRLILELGPAAEGGPG